MRTAAILATLLAAAASPRSSAASGHGHADASAGRQAGAQAQACSATRSKAGRPPSRRRSRLAADACYADACSRRSAG